METLPNEIRVRGGDRNIGPEDQERPWPDGLPGPGAGSTQGLKQLPG